MGFEDTHHPQNRDRIQSLSEAILPPAADPRRQVRLGKPMGRNAKEGGLSDDRATGRICTKQF